MQIGFSTADLYEHPEQLSRVVLDKQISLGASVIEVNADASMIRAKLLELPADYFKAFERKSLHAPASIDKSIMDELTAIQKKFNFEYINFHPDKIVDFNVLAESGLPVCIENMDSRKLAFRSVEDMQKVLEEYPFGMVLDLNHCYSNGGNMELVNEFWDKLGDRIKYFHLSGFITLHDPLYKTKQNQLIDFVESKDRPAVIESMLVSVAEMETEWHYIMDNLTDV